MDPCHPSPSSRKLLCTKCTPPRQHREALLPAHKLVHAANHPRTPHKAPTQTHPQPHGGLTCEVRSVLNLTRGLCPSMMLEIRAYGDVVPPPHAFAPVQTMAVMCTIQATGRSTFLLSPGMVTTRRPRQQSGTSHDHERWWCRPGWVHQPRGGHTSAPARCSAVGVVATRDDDKGLGSGHWRRTG